MTKKLEDMSLEELWQLFPIFLVPHDPNWSAQYASEAARIKSLLPSEGLIAVNHIGSTAIPDIWAKPIVDILVEVSDRAYMDTAKAILTQNGYRCMSESGTRVSLNRGYNEDGFAKEVFHLHLRLAGDNAELQFRDYLTNHPLVAKQYESLKLDLWKRYEHDRDGYTEAKTAFVTRYSNQK